jgi:diguanylate cyclase
MIWRTEDNKERLVNGLSSLFVLLPALAILVRWIETLNQPVISTLTDLTTGNLIFVSAMIYVMGWTFSLTVACYFKAQRRISQLAREDALTGLPNRRCIDEVFEQTLKEAKRYNRSFAVVVVDLDDFKLINDSFGHIAGDKLLRTVAERLKRFKRDADFVGRLGGDEFLLIVGNVSGLEQGERIIKRLVEVTRDSVQLEGEQVIISLSIGFAVWPTDGDTYDQLLGRADQRMYIDKSRHKSKQASEHNAATHAGSVAS